MDLQVRVLSPAPEIMSIKYGDVVMFGDGVPCPNRGCLGHVTHPCEMCGRRAARGDAQVHMGFLTVCKEKRIDGGETKEERVTGSKWIVHGKNGKKARFV